MLVKLLRQVNGPVRRFGNESARGMIACGLHRYLQSLEGCDFPKGEQGESTGRELRSVSEMYLPKCLGEVADSKRDGEEIESIPGLHNSSQRLFAGGHECGLERNRFDPGRIIPKQRRRQGRRPSGGH